MTPPRESPASSPIGPPTAPQTGQLGSEQLETDDDDDGCRQAAEDWELHWELHQKRERKGRADGQEGGVFSPSREINFLSFHLSEANKLFGQIIQLGPPFRETGRQSQAAGGHWQHSGRAAATLSVGMEAWQTVCWKEAAFSCWKAGATNSPSTAAADAAKLAVAASLWRRQARFPRHPSADRLAIRRRRDELMAPPSSPSSSGGEIPNRGGN